MIYNPEEYWHERGKKYEVSVDTFQELYNLEDLLINNVDINLEKDMVVEHGSGYGRIYNHLKFNLDNIENYYMCDISKTMIKNCYINTGQIPLLCESNTSLPFDDSVFDVLISFSVLLHVRPCDIGAIIKEYARVIKQGSYIYIATYYGGLDKLAEHCFEHNYRDMFEENDLQIIDEKFFMDGLRVNWLLRK